ncbi:MAG: dTDP-4-dehydrorhamnose 3,5-epimerase family protein [Planctomycetia bacterium]|nr:dTDP-4-dehydrorhamnose 3,5-epimerase family protein [Planctomycetia bacterium]
MNEEITIQGVEITSLKRFTDHRGWLTEIYRDDELPEGIRPAMSYVSETLPGVARGPHEHREQTDIFVFIGPGTFRLYLWDARKDSSTFGAKMKVEVGVENPARVIVPPGVVHAYRCVSDMPGWCINLPDKLYAGWDKKEPVDEIRHENDADSIYQLD